MKYESFVPIGLERKNEMLICSKCKQKEKDFNCFKLEMANDFAHSEYIQRYYLSFDHKGKTFHNSYFSLYESTICGPMIELNESDKYLELLENCFGKLT